MGDIIREGLHKASKGYECDACLFLQEAGRIDFLSSISEYRYYIEAKKNDFKIKKGDLYLRQFNKQGDSVYTFKAIPEIHFLCLKYSLYPEEY